MDENIIERLKMERVTSSACGRIQSERKAMMLAQLCTKCGQYSGERHKYCLVCVDKMKRNGQVEKMHDDSIIDIFNVRTPRKRRARNFRFGHIGGAIETQNSCVECKTEEKQFNSNLCLKCDAIKRELARSRDTTFSFQSFGNADLILALSQSSSSLVGVGRKADTRCLVCRKHYATEHSELCPKCLNKSKQQHIPVGRFYKDLVRTLKEASSVKDEFLSMEPIRGGIQWEISFNARKASLKQFLDNMEIMRPRNKEEREKHEDSIYQLKTLIDECTLHFERHNIRGSKQPNTTRY